MLHVGATGIEEEDLRTLPRFNNTVSAAKFT
jgi:hypothetical protein